MATADETLLRHAPASVAQRQQPPPRARKRWATTPELNRQERVITDAYLAMFVIVVAFLVVVALVAWLGA
jgi:hypothetical protein